MQMKYMIRLNHNQSFLQKLDLVEKKASMSLHWCYKQQKRCPHKLSSLTCCRDLGVLKFSLPAKLNFNFLKQPMSIYLTEREACFNKRIPKARLLKGAGVTRWSLRSLPGEGMEMEYALEAGMNCRRLL